MSGAVFETQRLVLRPPAVSDLERCAELLGDYEVAKMLARVPHPYDLAKGREFLRRSAANWAHWPAGDDVVFFITRDNDLIGGVSFKALHETPEIGYWLGRAEWGKGYMSEAVSAALTWFFKNTDHEIVLGTAMEENTRSLNILANCGFEIVGRSASMSLARGGYVPDVVMKLTRMVFAELELA